MKKTGKAVFTLSLLFSLGMLFFTFCTLAWHSDLKGFQWGFEIPLTLGGSFFKTCADALWLMAPFCLILSLVWFRKPGRRDRAGVLLSALPLSLYAVFRALSYLAGEKSHWILFFTLFCLVFCGAFTALSAFDPSLRKTASFLFFSYGAAETLLLVFSALFHEKYSLFYFYQLLPLGHTSHIAYSFVVISVYLYYLFYALAAGFRLLSPTKREEKRQDPPVPEDEEKKEEETQEIPLSLEDFGLQR